MDTGCLISPSASSRDVRDYLCVDQFLSDAIAVRILQTAIEIGLIDHMAKPGQHDVLSLQRIVNLDGQAFAFLLQQLKSAKVIQTTDRGVTLTPEFVVAWNYRDLLEMKMEFARTVTPDFVDSFTTLLRNPSEFFADSYLFSLFDYSRCFDHDPDSRMLTKRWMRYTTTLTRYEAPVLLSATDFLSYRHMLDIGGNSGELALQACRANPELLATVADLPLVCELGREHVAPTTEARRIRFLEGNWLTQAIPGRYDLVCFKSMLHDWPEPQTERFLRNAYEALVPGGTLLVFERSSLGCSQVPLSFGSLPILLFFRSYRQPSQYETLMRQAGFTEFASAEIMLDTPFQLITARKARSWESSTTANISK